MTDEELMKNLDAIVSDSREFQCYIDCLYRTIEVIDENGKIVLEKIYYLLPEEAQEVVDNITKTCGTKRKYSMSSEESKVD